MAKDIRDIIPTRRKTPEEESLLPKLRPKPTRSFSFKWKWPSVVVGIIVVGFGGYAVMSGATLTYVSKVSALSFNGDTLVAYKTASGGQLAFNLIKLSGEKSVSVPATGEETVSESASGQVMIYNEQATAQKLVKTTRLETPDGKIFRIREDVTIPAKGSLEVTAFADKPGVDYNIGLSDFTLPGLKGSARFEQVYARSKTAITGGFVGQRKKVTDSDLAQAKSTLTTQLKDDLLNQVKAQIPADYVMFSGLTQINYELLPRQDAAGNSATVAMRGNLNAAIFKQGDLAQYLALEKLGVNNVPSEVEIADFSKITIVFDSQTSTDLLKDATIKIKVSGLATAKFLTDEKSLAADLIGVKKDNLNLVLKQYPSIDTATPVIRPFWKSTFPTDVNKIRIKEQI